MGLTKRREQGHSRESSPPMQSAAQPARNERPESHRSRVGRPFQPGNPGKPKGARTKARLIGIEVMRAMAGRASARIEALVDSPSPRIALEAARLVLSYAWGAPRQTLELTGNFGDLAKELRAALADVRERRALEAAKPVVEAQVVTDASPGATEKPQLLEVGAVASPGEVVAPDAVPTNPEPETGATS